MNRKRVIGLLLIASGIILNQLELGNDIADFLMGAFVGSGAILLLSGLIKSNSKQE